MAVKFILGTAGSGKSHYCIEAMKEALLNPQPQQKLVFLVPEQATYQIERQILADERIGGYSDAYIVSFNRLGFWLVNRDVALEPLTKTAKYLIISRVLRENKDRLKVFGTMADQAGMVKKVASMITELYQCGKTSLDLMGIIRDDQPSAGSLSTRMAVEKFADIALIYDEYVDIVTGRFENPDAQLAIVKKYIASSELFAGCRLWVDGFSSFTQSEFEVLTELFKVCSDAEVALCMDGVGHRAEMFSPVIETKNKFDAIIAKNNLVCDEPIILGQTHRFKPSADLLHLEQNIFTQGERIASGGDVKIVSPLNISSEVEYIVDEINRLVFEQGYRYRDIAVILSDIDAYEVYVRQVFGDFQVPYFLDKRRSCLQHPLVHLLMSAMRVVRGGFERVDMFSFLKNTLTGLDKNSIQMLENYCICEGIEKAHWLGGQNWKCSSSSYGFDATSLNQLRAKAGEHLIWLYDNITDTMEAGRFVEVIFEFITRLNIGETLEQWQADSIGGEDGLDHGQVYSQVSQVLNEIASIFAGDELEVGVFIGSFCDSLTAITSSLIPPGQDQVTISEIERSRLPNVKAVFLAGTLAKKFPVAISDASLLTDYDRQFAADDGCQLEQGRMAKLSKVQYLSYIALTRASEKLYISWPRIDGGGKKQQCSDVISNIISLYDGLEISQAKELDSIENIRRDWQITDYLCVNGGRNNYARFSGKDIEPLKNDIEKEPSLTGCTSPLNKAMAYCNHGELSENLKNSMAYEQFEISVSKLQSYASCPYKYFSRYMLGLKPRELFDYDPLKKGIFYHDVLDLVSKHLIANSLGFADVDEKSLLEIACAKIEQVKAADAHFASIVDASRHNAFVFEAMKDEIVELLRSLKLMAGVSGMKLAASEMDFGFGNSNGFKLTTAKGKEVLLKGKIDRVDVCDSGQAVVYDYKSRNKVATDWQKMYYGLELQLPVYMLTINAATNGVVGDVEAIGAFYVPITSEPDGLRVEDGIGSLTVRKARGIYCGDYYNRIDDTLDAGDKSKFFAIALKKDGDFNKNSSGDMLTAEQLKQMLDFTENKICELSDSIMAGVISIKPHNIKGRLACEYCDYKSLCHFDRQINESRPLADMGRNKKDTFFELTTQGQEL